MTVVKGSVTRRAPKVHLVESPAAALTVKTVARFSGQRPVDTQAGGDWTVESRQEKVSHILRSNACHLSLCRSNRSKLKYDFL